MSRTNTLRLLSLWCIVVVCSGHQHRKRFNIPNDEWNWSCQTITSCQYVRWLKSTNQKYVCGGEGRRTEKIWCPIDPVKVAEEKCKEYSQLKYMGTTILTLAHNDIEAHHQFLSKIQRAMEKEFPHMALIGAREDDPKSEVEWICGGSLISSQYVLSAAHCNDLNNPAYEPTWVVLGEIEKPKYDVRSSTDRENVYRIVNRTNHPEYNSSKQSENDITLFKLDRPVVFGSTIRPVCLVLPPHAKYLHWPAMATGWGAMHAGESQSKDLLKVTLSLFHDSKCVEAFANETTMLSKGFDAERMICAGHRLWVGNKKDTCQGDSGGPLQFFIKHPTRYRGTWFQKGITSLGSSYCEDDKPGIYTKVSTYLPWIQGIVWPAV